MTNQAPIDVFKRALVGATKALAGVRELDVGFGGDVAGLVSRGEEPQIILPLPPTLPTKKAIAKSRGEADALALRLALHDADIFTQNQPKPGPARAIYEA